MKVTIRAESLQTRAISFSLDMDLILTEAQAKGAAIDMLGKFTDAQVHDLLIAEFPTLVESKESSLSCQKLLRQALEALRHGDPFAILNALRDGNAYLVRVGAP